VVYEIDEQLVIEARARIARERKRPLSVRLRPPEGTSLAGAEASVRLTRHAFRFGANAFNIMGLEDAGLEREYRERFLGLLNFGTLPFYWGSYEPEQGATREALLREMAHWCRAHGLAVKGHPLAWHEVLPAWAGDLSDEEVLRLLRERVGDLVALFRGLVDTWDVVNEATVSARIDNAVGRRVREEGALGFVTEMLRLAHTANPQAELLYNDFNIRTPDFFACPLLPDFELLVRGLLQAQAPLGALGIQSHMHARTWSLDEAWGVCEHYAIYGLPLHFTELTVLSGAAKDPNDADWFSRREGWLTTPAGEESQARYGEALYTLLYSHPAVEAITWWDFSDHHAWQGAPAGLVRADMSPKPLYERLLGLVWGEWATRWQGPVGEEGTLDVPCAAGEHSVEVRLPSGDTLAGTMTVPLRGRREVAVDLA
jgi:endo-1,4-beta-xylanase